MSVKLQAAIVAMSDPEQRKKLNVSELCRSEQVSRKTFYKWADRAVGVEHESRDALAVIDDLHVNVFIDGELIRHLRIDPTKTYQASGRKRGGPKRPRIA